ncbi:FAD/NAD(P)-binding protein [Amycolatopsis keratiniphila]|uniref:FAD-binding protein n=1 Tax=Amycolatopsis keratiniphila subsp. keratiniphila TaxID=227715 RepID=A0A1W2LGK1_9PSEU|nr:FAD/NAD(P)-binding protein [Amycolatopsis keratiniphila]ONF61884.1 FAD-binding protein [Amycolatopsis keratiniphila subsp. keratiniphila]
MRICIVGLGPRGLSVLERLCANASVLVPAGHELVVTVLDSHVHDGGLVWHRRQDPKLLMNTVAAQITMFLDDTVEAAGPVLRGPSLYDWAKSLSDAPSSDEIPDGVRREAALLGPDSYPSRAFYGSYLHWTLRRIIRTAPASVRIVLCAEKAVDLRDDGDGSQRVWLSGGTVLDGQDAVVLTQGHLDTLPTREETAMARFAKKHGLRYLAPGNPAGAGLDGIGPGEPTVLSGMGLSFFDYLALLTEGRGGRFVRTADGLVYRPSGREPRLIAGSRRGVPYHARGENQKGAYGRHEPLFLTAEVIERFRRRAEPADFRVDVWPLIDREVRAVFYGTLVRHRESPARAEEFIRAFVAAAGDRSSPPVLADPLAPVPSAREERVLAEFGLEERWDWRRVAHPIQEDDLTGTGRFRRRLRSYLDEDIAEAKRGNVSSPLKAALDVLRDLRNEIRLVVDHGGLSGDSYRDDLQGWYTPLNAFLSIGPPVRRVEEMAALIDSGVLSVLGPRLCVRASPDARRFVASSARTPDVTEAATTLIEARLPEADLRRTKDLLLRNLLARGECRLHRIPISRGGSYPTGGLAVTRRPYRLVDIGGRPHARRFAFGVPTETVHWVTAAGIRPGVNSVILTDADAVARAGLEIASPNLSPSRPKEAGESWIYS